MSSTTTATPGATDFLSQRYVKSSDLINAFNPQRLMAQGPASPGIGGDPATQGPMFIFVTRPDLNLADAQAPRLFGVGTPMAPQVLCDKLSSGGFGFIELLTNLAMSYTAQDVSLDISQVGEGWDGARVPVSKNTLNSRQDGTMQIEYQEWSGLPVTLLHKVWVDYAEAVSRGNIAPKTTPDYIKLRQLDHAVAIYAFQCLPDATTVEWGAKWTGCIPTAIPTSSWAGQIGGHDVIKVTVPYSYAFYEPLDAAIFADFNIASGASTATSSSDGSNPAESGGAPSVTSGVWITKTNPNLTGTAALRDNAYYLVFGNNALDARIPGGL